jgi:FkbM family methyltransferase
VSNGPPRQVTCPRWRKPSSFVRHVRLIRRIRNWPLYLARHYFDWDVLTFRTRRGGIAVEVPRGLFFVFKEIAIYDVYRLSRTIAALGPQPVIVDVGANAGYFSVFALALSPRASVHSYEPMPANFQVLQRNHALNPRVATRWHVYPAAVTGAPRASIDLFFEADKTLSSYASAYQQWVPKAARRVSVPAIALSQILDTPGIGTIDLLKLDCEGAEYEILFDSPAGVLQRVSNIVLETHTGRGSPGTHRDIVNFLQAQGYATEELILQDDYLHIVWATRAPAHA